MLSHMEWLRASGQNWAKIEAGYDIEDEHIVPQNAWQHSRKLAPGSTPDNTGITEYDPFLRYFGPGQPQDKKRRSIYLELSDVNPDDAADVLGFTNRYGLLGLFHHNLFGARYLLMPGGWAYPKHDPPPFLYRELLEGKPYFHGGEDLEEVFEYHGVSYSTFHPLPSIDDAHPEDHWGQAIIRELEAMGVIREDGGAWTEAETGHKLAVPLSELPEDVVEMARAQAREDLMAYGKQALARWENDPSKSGTVIVPTREGHYEQRPLNHYFRKYYPTLGEGPYPALSAPWRWSILCEPLGEFQAAARQFQHVFHEWIRLRSGDESEPGFSHVQELLTPHLRHVSPMPRVVESEAWKGKWTWGWRFPSLLAACYMMMFMDMVAGQMPRKCGNLTCLRTFVTTRSNQYYCHPSCQQSEKQRRYRQRKKYEQELNDDSAKV